MMDDRKRRTEDGRRRIENGGRITERQKKTLRFFEGSIERVAD